jgi:hypothetical protein
MVRLAALAVVLAGCDVAFGLSDLRPTIDALDAPTFVTGRVHAPYVANDATFRPMTGDRIYAPGTVSFGATLDDASQPTVAYRTDGTFSFPLTRAGQRYRLVVNGNEYQAGTPQLALSLPSAGHPDRAEPLMTFIKFDFPLAIAGQGAAWISSTGIYTFSYTGMFGPTVTFDWRLASPAANSVSGLLDASKHDRVYAIDMTGDATTVPGMTYTTIKSVSSASVTQSYNSTAALPPPQPAARNQCVRFAAANRQQYDRLVAAAARSYTRSLATWLVDAAPAPDTVALAGLHWVAVNNYTPITDIDIAPTFHNPYPGTTLLAESSVVGYFNLQLPGSIALEYGDVITRYARVEPGNPTACMSPKVAVGGEVGIPGHFQLGGTPLDADGTIIVLDLGRPVELTWDLAGPGRADNFSVGVYELQIVGGATVAMPVKGVAVHGSNTAVFDASLFVPGKKYVIVIGATVGRPNIATGDWSMTQLPFEYATVWSHYFEVKPL